MRSHILRCALLCSLLLVSPQGLAGTSLNFVPKEATIEEPAYEQNLECLTQNLYFESRGEPLSGIIAVGYVTLNRAKVAAKDICWIVHQSATFKGQKFCQFSWTCFPMPQMRIADSNMYDVCKLVASQVLRRLVPDTSNGALFYHEKRVNPTWSKKKTITAIIGHHIFYN